MFFFLILLIFVHFIMNILLFINFILLNLKLLCDCSERKICSSLYTTKYIGVWEGNKQNVWRGSDDWQGFIWGDRIMVSDKESKSGGGRATGKGFLEKQPFTRNSAEGICRQCTNRQCTGYMYMYWLLHSIKWTYCELPTLSNRYWQPLNSVWKKKLFWNRHTHIFR